MKHNVRADETYCHNYHMLQRVKTSKVKWIYDSLISNPLAPSDSYNKWKNVIDGFVSLEDYCGTF